MPIHGLQATFAGGEFAPTLYGRVDLQRWGSGLRKARNVIIHPHGGASNRPGTRWIASTKYSNKLSRLVRFEFSTTQAYMIEFGDGYCRFYKDQGQILKSSPAAWATSTAYVVGNFVAQSGTTYYCVVAHTSGTFATDLGAGKWVAQSVYEIPTSYLEADLSKLVFAQSADQLFITKSNYQIRVLTRSAHDSWTLSLFAYEGGPFMLSNLDAAKTIYGTVPAWVTSTAYTAGQFVTESGYTYQCLVNHTSGTFATDVSAGNWIKTIAVVGGSQITVTAAAPLFNSLHVGALWRWIHKVSNQAIKASIATGASEVILCGGTYRIYTTGTWTGSIVVEKSVDAGKTWTPIRTFITNVDTFGSTGEEQCLVRVNRPTASGYYPLGGGGSTSQTGTANVDLMSDPFSWTSIVKITGYTNGTTVTAQAQGYCIARQANSTSDWAEGSWSDYRGYPSCVVFFQDRLCFGATPAEPQTVWESETETYTSFARSTPLVDSDGITVRLPSRKVNIIRSLVPLRQILALTSSADWAIYGSNGVMTPTTAATAPQSERGCAEVQPAVVGNRVIIVSPKGRTVRDLGFDFQSDGYAGDTISVYSGHLFDGYTIKAVAYAQEPDSVVWFVRSDGVLLSLTYMREQEVLAWTWHDTEGAVESLETIPGTDRDEVWMIVKRTNGRFVELLEGRLKSKDPQDQFYVDAGLSLDSPITVTGVTAANPVVVTAPGHGLSDGDFVDLSDIVSTAYVDANGEKIARGMDARDTYGAINKRLNGGRFIVANKTVNTFELKDEDGNLFNGSDLSAYVSGGYVRKCVTSVSGLGHLEGQQVAILANGCVLPRQTVTGAAVPLGGKASRVHVGLPYRSELETLNLEIPQRDGTMQGRKVKISEVTVRVADTMALKFGPSDGSAMDDLIERPEDLQEGAPMPLFSGDSRKPFPGEHEDFGRILLRQDDPLPMTILALAPRVNVGS